MLSAILMSLIRRQLVDSSTHVEDEVVDLVAFELSDGCELLAKRLTHSRRHDSGSGSSNGQTHASW
jgi:hypothetical protein